ncbi:aspartyl protease family protein [Marchantia polymorpha subsp. ruderalis]|uniref:Peptidase A1 domain-containing protein n=1 Tax=Marchantia polymorpha TaxID=3197 RepID=A0A2R6XB14_MARPO|nr:hypothetical protein MARPO_0025s0006 [Marchantia polymorpha]BBN03837.1 hypothetical protein Mp_2g26790 [Marchantia polymorpha subsp. ruderalis]|eukprot:PTQ43297.1 hypothetical protein MARPO_0025s0006 [Marchantia polymorpha]
MGNRGARLCLILLCFIPVLVEGRAGSKGKKFHTLQINGPPDYSSRVADAATFAGSTQSQHDKSDGLVVELWHRNSPNSPFLPKDAKHEDLVKQSLLRDKQRLAMFSDKIEMASRGLTMNDLSVPQDPSSISVDTSSDTANLVSPVISGLTLGSGEYFTRMEVGTPGEGTYLVVDTGSDILWMQCNPCSHCYSQHDPIFNPMNSSSFDVVPCYSSSGWCQALNVGGCIEDKCLYQVSYGDGSFTIGYLSSETFTMGTTKGGDKVKIKNVPFGCGYDNEGLFVGAAGILGLGKGSLSFPNQLESRYSRRFSYCLTNRESGEKTSSSLIFGDAAIPTGSSKIKYTPQLFNEKIPSFYYVGLTGISVGGSLLEIPSETFQLKTNTGKGGVIVDSGTSITWFNSAGYNIVRDAFRDGTENLPGTTAPFDLFDTCYDLSNFTSVEVPTLTLHFEGGAELDLPAKNYVIPVDEIGRYCLAFASSSSNFSIIGNVQQQNFRVVYDNVEGRIGFEPDQCY